MVSVEYSEAIVEVLDILNHSEEEIIEKIPKKLIDFFEENKSNTYKSNLDHNKTLEQMNLKKKTRAIITMIYVNYLCDNNERKYIEKILQQNEIKYQEELKKKYNVNNLFRERKQEEIDDVNENETAMLEYKKSTFKKIIMKIKKLFKKN